MTVAGWLLDVAAVVLIAAGALKLVDPGYTSVALRAMGLPSSAAVVRAGASVEAAVGASVLTVRSAVPALILAGSYAAFSAFVLLARRRGVPITSCGCLGSVDTPPTVGHVALTTVIAAGAVWAALETPESLFDAIQRRTGVGLAFALAVGIGAYAVFCILAARPLLRMRQ